MQVPATGLPPFGDFGKGASRWRIVFAKYEPVSYQLWL